MKKKDLSGNKYLDMNNDISISVIDTYFDTISSKWVAKIEKETGETDTIPIEKIKNDDNICLLP